MRRGLLQYLHYPALGELGLFPVNADPYFLPRNRMVHKNHEAIYLAQGFAAKGQLVDDQIDFPTFG
jgi:hypothetical protein